MFTQLSTSFLKNTKGCIGALLLLFSMNSHAAIIEQETTLIGGNTYQLDFNVVNDSIASGIFHWFVTLDGTLFENLVLLSGPTGWDTFVINSATDNHTFGAQPPGFFPAPPGFPFISLGNEQGGFSLQVDFLGSGVLPFLPGGVANEDFTVEVGDFTLNSPLVSVSGSPTNPGTPPAQVPEPSTLLLLTLAFFAIGILRRQQNAISLSGKCY